MLFILKIWSCLFLEFLREYWHGTILCADVSRHLDRQLMCLSHALATKDACHKCAREGIACTHRVRHLYLRSLDE